MSASEVTCRCGTASSSWAAMTRSKTVATSGTPRRGGGRAARAAAAARPRGRPARRRRTACLRARRGSASSSGSRMPATSAPASSSAVLDLLEEVADAGEEDATAPAGSVRCRAMTQREASARWTRTRVAFARVTPAMPSARCRPSTRSPRRSTRRARWRSPPRAPCWRRAAPSCSRAAPATPTWRPGRASGPRRPRGRRCGGCSTRPGVIVHTNLGRAPLAAAAREAVARGRRGLLEPRVGPRGGRARLPPRPRRGAAVRADGRRGGDGGQQLRRGDAARRGRRSAWAARSSSRAASSSRSAAASACPT